MEGKEGTDGIDGIDCTDETAVRVNDRVACCGPRASPMGHNYGRLSLKRWTQAEPRPKAKRGGVEESQSSVRHKIKLSPPLMPCIPWEIGLRIVLVRPYDGSNIVVSGHSGGGVILYPFVLRDVESLLSRWHAMRGLRRRFHFSV